MKNYYLHLLLILSFCIISVIDIPSAVLPKFNNAVSNNTENFSSDVPAATAFTITVPGKEVAPGKYTLAKVYNIPRLKAGEYLSNTIIIKTKRYEEISADGKAILASGLTSQLQSLGINNIRAPHKEYSQGNLLAKDKFGLGRILELNYSAPVDPYDICKELMRSGEVEYAVPVFIHKPNAFTPNDPYYTQQFHLARTQCSAAWDISKGDKSVKIAIVDSGVDWNHEDLKANIWTNPNEIPNNGVDDDGNGKIDDIRGWDFVGNITYQQAVNGQFQEDNDPTNISGFHGTHVAGLASAVTNNGTGVSSPGFSCSIIPVKCGSDNNQAGGGIFRGYEGMLYASRLGADVINCSWGGPGASPYEQDIINQATANGSVVVVASGNDGQNIDDGGQYPAGYDNVMPVGSSESTDRYSTWGNYGNSVTTYTPGNGVLSTLPNNQYYNLTGTSMSSPIAAGIVGLTKSVHKNMTPMQLIRQIHSTSDNVLTNNQDQRYLYYGRANAYKALMYNNADYPDNKIPGILASEVTIESSDKIRSFDPVVVGMKLTNYLAPATNLKVKISPVQLYLDVLGSNVSVGSLGTMESKDIEVIVQVNKAIIPWYQGYVHFLLTFESEGYIDYQLIRLPLELPTKNVFNPVISFQGAPILWNNARSPSKDVFWAAGNYYQGGGDTIGLAYNNVIDPLNPLKVIAQSPVWCIYAFDENNALAGGGVGATSIYRSTNGGMSWTSQNASYITPFINEIYFYDQNLGYAFGDPGTDRVWGIGKTTDGGNTWTKISGVPTPNSNETGYVGCYNFLGDNIWFGTSNGRVYHSSDRGQTWDVSAVYPGGHVVDICFTDNNNGVAIYAEGTNLQTANRMLASTTDGGATWKTALFNFTALGFYPAYTYNIQGTKVIAIMMSSGEIYSTPDYGTSWQTILTRKYATIHVGAGIKSGNTTRLWHAGSAIAYLDINEVPDVNSTIKEIKGLYGNEVFFGNILMGYDTLVNVYVKNTGNASITFDSLFIESGSGSKAGEFVLQKLGMPKGVPVLQSVYARVKFIPDTIKGIRTAKLVILSNADSPRLEIELIGNAVEDVTSVPEITEANGIRFISIAPNPATDEAELYFELPKYEPVFFRIISSSGSTIETIPAGSYSAGFNNIKLNTANYPTGAYYCIMQAGTNLLYRKFIVAR